MQLTYLCPKHTDWIYNNPAQAIHFLNRNELQGSLLYQRGCYSDAIPYLGCAFDIAAILLELEEEERPALIKTVRSLALQLSMAYHFLQERSLVEAINLRAMWLLNAANVPTNGPSLPT